MRVFPFHPNGNNGAPEFPDILLEEGQELDPSDGSDKKYHSPPARYDDRVWTLGWTDGRLGQPEEINAELLRAQADVNQQKEIRKVRSQIAGAQAKVEMFKARLGHIQKKLDDVQSYYLELWKRRNKNITGASLPLALMYLVFGLMLFLADVPLSLQLVAAGFKIPSWKNLATGERVDVDAIFSDTWFVLNNLWEPLFLALGIALMGIIVKLFLDTVIFHSEEEDPPLTRKRNVGMIVALLLFLVATLSLGFFRAEAMKIAHSGKILDYEQATFIFLTLALPIAGGLCFSVGWRRLERAKNYYFTLLRLRWLEWRFERATLAFSEQAQLVRSLTPILEGDAIELAKAETALRKSLYLHGYQRGQNVPETLVEGATLYGVCERALKRVLARKVRHKLQLEP